MNRYRQQRVEETNSISGHLDIGAFHNSNNEVSTHITRFSVEEKVSTITPYVAIEVLDGMIDSYSWPAASADCIVARWSYYSYSSQLAI